MLRADAAAVLAVSDGRVRTVFAHRVDPATDWLTLVGATAVEDASHSAHPIVVALPAGRWDERLAYAALARLDALETPALLCLLRHLVPFDPIELSSAESAAALLAIGAVDSRAGWRETMRAETDPARARRADGAAPPWAGAPEVDDVPLAEARALRASVAEGRPATRIGLRAILTGAGIGVVGSAATCAETIALARELRADVALVDLGLADVRGADALARIAAAAPALPLVAFAGEGAAVQASEALAAGAAGFLEKDAPAARIVAALRAVANGLVAVPRADPPRERATAVGPGPAPGSAGTGTPAGRAAGGREAVRPPEPVTPRELALLRYLAEGHTNKEIARAMALAEDTVKKAVQTLVGKLGATDRTNAVVVALRTGLIT